MKKILILVLAIIFTFSLAEKTSAALILCSPTPGNINSESRCIPGVVSTSTPQTTPTSTPAVSEEDNKKDSETALRKQLVDLINQLTVLLQKLQAERAARLQNLL